MMMPCEKTRSTNADVAGTLKRRENSRIRELYSVSVESFVTLQSSQFTAEMYFDSLTSSKALYLKVGYVKKTLK